MGAAAVCRLGASGARADACALGTSVACASSVCGKHICRVRLNHLIGMRADVINYKMFVLIGSLQFYKIVKMS